MKCPENLKSQQDQNSLIVHGRAWQERHGAGHKDIIHLHHTSMTSRQGQTSLGQQSGYFNDVMPEADLFGAAVRVLQ